jgi:ArsR family transcriptional regulator, arsenate/arsenite/antimonite-responsive transcriptional repressor
MTDHTLPKFMAVSKALADENRVRILALLQGRSLCVCQIIAVLGLAPSTVSKHLSILRRGGLLEIEKRGRWIHCRLAGADAAPAAKEALRWLRSSLERSERMEADRRELGRVLKVSPETLCRRMMGS